MRLVQDSLRQTLIMICHFWQRTLAVMSLLPLPVILSSVVLFFLNTQCFVRFNFSQHVCVPFVVWQNVETLEPYKNNSENHLGVVQWKFYFPASNSRASLVQLSWNVALAK